MLKKGLLQICFLLITFTISSQIEFEPGYYIKESGEKIQGYILNIDWKNNPTSFNFKTSLDGEDSEIEMQEIIEYGVNGFSKYQKYIVDIDKSTSARIGMSDKRNPIFEKDTLLLKVLIDGELSLYKYETVVIKRYFYKKVNENPVQLVYKKYYKTPDRIAENIDFQQQIKNMSGEGLLSGNKMKNLKYTEKSMVQVFKDLNSKGDHSFVSYSKAQRGFKPYFSIVGGTRYFNDGLSNSSLGYTSSIPYSFSYLLGAESEFVLPFRKDTWSIYLGGYYNSFSGEKNFNHEIYAIDQPEGKINYDYSSLEFSLGFRNRFFINEKPKFYAFGAATLNVPLKNKLYRPRERELIINTSSSFYVGVGYIVIPKVTIEFSYATPRNYLTAYTYWNSKQQGFSFLVKCNL